MHFLVCTSNCSLYIHFFVCAYNCYLCKHTEYRFTQQGLCYHISTTH